MHIRNNLYNLRFKKKNRKPEVKLTIKSKYNHCELKLRK